jgi:hypothetical protein
MVISKASALRAVIALPFLAVVAGAQGTSPASCSSQAPPMAPFDTTKVASLVGTFDVVMVDTTSLRGGVRQHAGKLLLFLQDSVPKRRASMARAVGQQFMVGTFIVAPPDSGDMWDNMVSRTTDTPGVFWANGFLRLGEFGTKSGISLYVKLATDTELRGMWTSHPGTTIVDFTGAREPDEAGYFCARRVK